tara:strand:- start:1209 stop:1418 length:210 start_codon:yes stop_codon:yes gene_type:complete
METNLHYEKHSLILKVINYDNEETALHLIEDNAADMLVRLIETINSGYYDNFTNEKIILETLKNKKNGN